MNILKKIFGIFLNIIMLIVFIIMLMVGYCFFQVNVSNKDYVNIFGYSFFQIRTGSMENELKIGDVVIIKILDLDDKINEKDIISYKEEEHIITHRVIEIKDNTLIAKGDANNTNDDPISREQVIGKVVKVIPNVSIWIDVFKTKEVYRAVIVTIVLFILTFSINTENKELIKKTIDNTEAETMEEKNEEKKG